MLIRGTSGAHTLHARVVQRLQVHIGQPRSALREQRQAQIAAAEAALGKTAH